MLLAACLALSLQLNQSDNTPDLPADLVQRTTDWVLVARNARPAVVYIESDVMVQRRDFFGTRSQLARSAGSGAVIYEEGLVVTNYHVVKDAQRITVQFDETLDNRVYEASLVNFARDEDLALLKIDAEGPFPTLPLGTSSDLMLAEEVMAIGSPAGQRLTVSRGIVSGLHREIEAGGLKFKNLIQTDASINLGNSGGPLLNVLGELIGINTVMNVSAENIGFAIPVDRVKWVLEDSLLSPDSARAWFGFKLRPETLEVGEVLAGGPAEAAGLQVGDRLERLGNLELRDVDQYRRALVTLLPGDSAELWVHRGEANRRVEVQSWARADGVLYDRTGLQLERQVFGRRLLLRVVDVRQGSPADSLGIRPGDLIASVRLPNGQIPRLRAPEDLAIEVGRYEPGQALELNLWRDLNGNGVLDTRSGELLEGGLRLR